MSLLIRNFLFTVVVPGSGAVWIPWWILSRRGPIPAPAAWYAASLIVIGAALYLSCVWHFAIVGRGTPGPWDAPRQFVAVGPYRWVRNPIYIAALLVVLGEAWLFLSLPLLLYSAAMAILLHLFVMGYEEPTLRRRFGETYEEYHTHCPALDPAPAAGMKETAASFRIGGLKRGENLFPPDVDYRPSQTTISRPFGTKLVEGEYDEIRVLDLSGRVGAAKDAQGRNGQAEPRSTASSPTPFRRAASSLPRRGFHPQTQRPRCA